MSSKEKKLEHISFIMDGNGRWAKKRLLPRTFGHKEGVKKAKEVILHAKSHAIPFVSLYTFSKENWKRPDDEVSFLMKLIIDHFKNDFQFYIDNQIRIIHIGDKNGIPMEVRNAIEEIENELSILSNSNNKTDSFDYLDWDKFYNTKAFINSLPIIFLLVSGSLTPFNLSKK